MPRRIRVATGGYVYHVVNRAVGRNTFFESDGDYAAFLRVVRDVHGRLPVRILSFCVMPNHWHFVLHPREDGELSEFMRLLTVTHTQRWHAAHGTAGTGPLYQGRFKSFPVQGDEHVAWVCRYVERNPLRARLVPAAGDWAWSSLAAREAGTELEGLLVPPRDWPGDVPADWNKYVHAPQTPAEENAVRLAVRRSRPLGRPRWVTQTATRLGLGSTLQNPGRPRIDRGGRRGGKP